MGELIEEGRSVSRSPGVDFGPSHGVAYRCLWAVVPGNEDEGGFAVVVRLLAVDILCFARRSKAWLVALHQVALLGCSPPPFYVLSFDRWSTWVWWRWARL